MTQQDQTNKDELLPWPKENFERARETIGPGTPYSAVIMYALDRIINVRPAPAQAEGLEILNKLQATIDKAVFDMVGNCAPGRIAADKYISQLRAVLSPIVNKPVDKDWRDIGTLKQDALAQVSFDTIGGGLFNKNDTFMIGEGAVAMFDYLVGHGYLTPPSATGDRLEDLLERESWDLRCEDVPTGGDDYDIEWAVYSHHMAEPKLREEGRGSTIAEAIKAALERGE